MTTSPSPRARGAILASTIGMIAAGIATVAAPAPALAADLCADTFPFSSCPFSTEMRAAIKASFPTITDDMSMKDVKSTVDGGVLSMPAGNVNDWGPIGALTTLRGIDASGNQFADINGMWSDMAKLEFLDVSDNPVTSMTVNWAFPNLKRLVVSDTDVAELASLDKMPTLDTIELSRTAVKDLSPLTGLTGLRSITAEEIGLADLSPLKPLTALEELNVGGNPLTDLSVVADFTKLTRLGAADCGITDILLLAGLLDLRDVDLRNNHVTDLLPLAAVVGSLESLQVENQTGTLDPIQVHRGGLHAMTRGAFLPTGDLAPATSAAPQPATLEDWGVMWTDVQAEGDYTMGFAADVPYGTAGKTAAFTGSIAQHVIPMGPYTVAFDSAGGSAVDSQTVPWQGIAFEPLAPTRDGWAFKGWTAGAEGPAWDFASVVTGDMTLVAHWEPAPAPAPAPAPTDSQKAKASASTSAVKGRVADTGAEVAPLAAASLGAVVLGLGALALDHRRTRR